VKTAGVELQADGRIENREPAGGSA